MANPLFNLANVTNAPSAVTAPTPTATQDYLEQLTGVSQAQVDATAPKGPRPEIVGYRKPFSFIDQYNESMAEKAAAATGAAPVTVAQHEPTEAHKKSAYQQSQEDRAKIAGTPTPEEAAVKTNVAMTTLKEEALHTAIEMKAALHQVVTHAHNNHGHNQPHHTTAEVKEIQQFSNDHMGTHLKVDGVEGKNTQQAEQQIVAAEKNHDSRFAGLTGDAKHQLDDIKNLLKANGVSHGSTPAGHPTSASVTQVIAQTPSQGHARS